VTQKVKVHILFDFVESAWGGGNQFLKAIKDYLVNNDRYVDNYRDADVILLNSHHNALKAIKIKLKNKHIKFVHRIDGPIYYYREDGYYLDKLIFALNAILANGTIFQSYYTKQASVIRGINLINQTSSIITNAPDSLLFFPKKNNFLHKKIRLIATSWSGNMKKGFDIYAWLDKNLDFYKYEMIFIGNSPIQFNNIIHKKPMRSTDLAVELRKADIFIFASKVESCSNSLLEAMHCGLPVLAYNGSSNPEIVKSGGKLFNKVEEIPKFLDEIVANYIIYQKGINLPCIKMVGNAYLRFFDDICIYVQNKKYKKSINLINYFEIKKLLFYCKSIQKINFIKKKLGFEKIC